MHVVFKGFSLKENFHILIQTPLMVPEMSCWEWLSVISNIGLAPNRLNDDPVIHLAKMT